ncbi:MAG: aminodeoxychorismate synthase component I [Neisseriaceae bacterium]
MQILVKKLEYVEPQVIFDYVADKKYTIFLDSSMLHEHYGRYSVIVINPVEIFHPSANIEKHISYWKQLFAYNQSILQQNYQHLPFTGGLVGFLSYDLSKKIEFISEDIHKIVDDFYFGLYNQAFIFDLFKQDTYIITSEIYGYDLPYLDQFKALEQIYNNCNVHQLPTKTIEIPKVYFKSNFTQQQYINIINRAIKYIRDGDIFEVNLAQCFSTEVINDYPCKELYKKLRYINSAPFSSYINLGSLVIMSASPERFLSIHSRKVETRPIKGTIRRSADPKEDLNLAKKLQHSEKDHAENIMIVDLMRNDLSKICKKDSVKVTKLCDVEPFTNIHHLVSVIEGELKESVSIFDIIKAAFPGGSITGAPKIRAMQIIEELEPTKRGVYCGSIGYFSLNGNLDLSIAIRTIIKNGTDMRFYSGGAITLDSDPVREYQETLLKAQKINEIFNRK